MMLINIRSYIINDNCPCRAVRRAVKFYIYKTHLLFPYLPLWILHSATKVPFILFIILFSLYYIFLYTQVHWRFCTRSVVREPRRSSARYRAKVEQNKYVAAGGAKRPTSFVNWARIVVFGLLAVYWRQRGKQHDDVPISSSQSSLIESLRIVYIQYRYLVDSISCDRLTVYLLALNDLTGKDRFQDTRCRLFLIVPRSKYDCLLPAQPNQDFNSVFLPSICKFNR